jgi:7,8-dihydropterin-6-yl-methyl-4-(beta-D-ribofuranosyl)aminobenzene 5'-phosphate synthase
VSSQRTQTEPIIDVVFDNAPGTGSLAFGWGFSCLIRWGAETILFDTGNEGEALLGNLRHTGVSPGEVNHLFLSHAHGDHAGGLMAFIGANPQACVYLLKDFPRSLRLGAKFHAKRVVELETPSEILPRIWSTGPVGGSVPEHALVLKADRGLVVITGCAHPGVEEIVARAQDVCGGGILLLLGGLHLLEEPGDAVAAVAESLLRSDVEYLAACHCTGGEAIQTLRDVFGERFLDIRTGTRIDTALLEATGQ